MYVDLHIIVRNVLSGEGCEGKCSGRKPNAGAGFGHNKTVVKLDTGGSFLKP